MSITIDIYSGKCLYSEEFAQKFIELLEKYNLFTNKIGLYEPVRTSYTKKIAMEMHLDLKSEGKSTMGGVIGKIKKPNITYTTNWDKKKDIVYGNMISFFITKGAFSKNEKFYLKLFKELVLLTDANFAYITSDERSKIQHVRGTLQNRLPGVFWANYYGKTLTNFFEKQTILNANWHSVEELGNGMFTLLTDEKGVYTISGEMEENIKKQFKKDSFGDPENFDFLAIPPRPQIKDVPKFIIRDWD